MLEKFNVFKRYLRKGEPSQETGPSDIFRQKYERFKELLDSNAELSRIIADMEEKLQGHEVFGMSYLRSRSARAVFHAVRMVNSLSALSGKKCMELLKVLDGINTELKVLLETRKESATGKWIFSYSEITREMVDRVGGKSANLGEVHNRVGLPTPEGFAITTDAFDFFMSENDLFDEINREKMAIDPADAESIVSAGEAIQRLILSAPVPRDLRDSVLSAYDDMAAGVQQTDSSRASSPISMRSSAVGEDSELSFAGQYVSILNVPREKIVETYNVIVASLYSPRAISYRLSKGIRDEDIAMSVACLRMVDSVASGVIYSRHPSNVLEDSIIVTAVFGLGPYAVDGIITPDMYTISRNDGRILQSQIARKSVQLVTSPKGGLTEMPVLESMRSAPCLSPEQLSRLAGFATDLETHYGRPQDIEWALDSDGRLFVLQTRPLRIEKSCADLEKRPVPTLHSDQVLIEGGAVAFPGIGCGKAYQVHSDADLPGFPSGAVLVAKHSSPKFVVVMPKARAIVTDAGSVTGHMASLAREFAVPTLLGVKTATSVITTGMEVTVDAYSRRVYRGIVPELSSIQSPREPYMKDTPVYESLKRVADLIVPLRLLEPRSPDFQPGNCRSLHDIMRFVHECSYMEMFKLSDQVSAGRGCAVKLDAHLPLDLYVIDLGGGLSEEISRHTRLGVEKVVSVPFRALLKGMLHEGLSVQKPRPVQLKGFFSVMSEQMLNPVRTEAERFGDRSYAIISDRYLNFSSRVGYHYSVLDCYCGQTLNKNYITFLFKGGAANDTRRGRRARAIALILESLDFSAEVIADRVDARLQKFSAEVIEDKLDAVGRLLQFTRQMDMLMNDEASVAAMAKAFLEGNYHLDPQDSGAGR